MLFSANIANNCRQGLRQFISGLRMLKWWPQCYEIANILQFDWRQVRLIPCYNRTDSLFLMKVKSSSMSLPMFGPHCQPGSHQHPALWCPSGKPGLSANMDTLNLVSVPLVQPEQCCLVLCNERKAVPVFANLEISVNQLDVLRFTTAEA